MAVAHDSTVILILVGSTFILATLGDSSTPNTMNGDQPAKSTEIEDERGFLGNPVIADMKEFEALPIRTALDFTGQLDGADEAKVEEFYVRLFETINSASCCRIGRAFVKYVEPEIRAKYSYKGNPAPWWPNTAGENSVRYNAPERLCKPG
jgi:hypothetical protein